MNRIITILVTIFILLLLYIWISHVWGSDNPRPPRQIVDAREGEALGTDDMSVDTFSTLLDDEEDESTGLGIDEKPAADSDNEYSTDEPVTNKIVNSAPAKPENISQQVEEKKPVVQKVEPKKEEPKVEVKKKATPPPATKTSQPITKPTTVPADADGKHLVIVGNFLQAVNANQRMEELKKAGFTDVEVVNFDLSEYHTVCAGRFDDINEARRLVKKLKDYHKIDAYVRIGS